MLKRLSLLLILMHYAEMLASNQTEQEMQEVLQRKQTAKLVDLKIHMSQPGIIEVCGTRENGEMVRCKIIAQSNAGLFPLRKCTLISSLEAAQKTGHQGQDL